MKEQSCPDLVAAASDLVPFLTEHAEDNERSRRLTFPTVDALRNAGLFGLAAPKAVGGFEADVRTCMEVTAKLSQGDPAAGWVVLVMTGGSFVAALLEQAGRKQVWGEGANVPIAASLTSSGHASRVDGGARVSGRWSWASGVDHAKWVAVAAPLMDASGQPVDQIMALLPADEIKIEDTWHTAGMAGTGTNTAVVEDVFVPASRLLSIPAVLAGGYAVHDENEPLYRTSVVSFFAISVVGPMLGMARSVLDLSLQMMARKPMSLTNYARLADSPGAQIALANAASLIDTAEMHGYRGAADLDRAAREGRQLTVAERARVRMDAGVAASRAREAVDLLLSVTGASSFAVANPVQRIWRDLEVASRHLLVSPNLAGELYGRALLGIEERATLLI